MAEEWAYTPWFSLDHADETVKQFLRAVHMTKLSFANFFGFIKTSIWRCRRSSTPKRSAPLHRR
ncbi:hypothetical protein [Geobacillus zalihae]|uniref:hypothetical protein n=1 Tax=Geobacillus zalihae TaxID=213419 RepID=UPI0037C1B08B